MKEQKMALQSQFPKAQGIDIQCLFFFQSALLYYQIRQRKAEHPHYLEVIKIVSNYFLVTRMYHI